MLLPGVCHRHCALWIGQGVQNRPGQRLDVARFTDQLLVTTLLDASARTQSPLLPSHWAARGVLSAATGRYGAAVFDFQKLRWMNGMYIRACELSRVTDLFIPHLHEAGYDTTGLERAWLERVIDAVRGNCEVLSDVARHAALFLDDIIEPDAEAAAMLQEPDSKTVVAEAHRLITGELDEAAYAAPRISAALEKVGATIAAPPEGFIVTGTEGPLKDGELPRAGEWAKGILADL